jgi:hypothetical protein
MSAKNEAKINENKPDFNERNTTKFNKDYNNFNERVTNTLNQQQNAINKTLDNTLNNVRKNTDEARREIPQHTQRIAEYQEKTIQIIRDIASDFIETQKQVIGSFHSQQVDRSRVWNWYNPQRIAENYSLVVNNFTNYLLNTANLVNNALESNIRVYNTALEQTRDNLKTWTKTNTDFIKSSVVQQESVSRHNTQVNTTTSH